MTDIPPGFDDGSLPEPDTPLVTCKFDALLPHINALEACQSAMTSDDFKSITGVSLNAHIVQEARLDRSLVEEAIHTLSKRLPGHVSPDQIKDAMDEIITEAEELDIRQTAITGEGDFFSRLSAISGYRDFIKMIFDHTETIDFVDKGNRFSTKDPNSIKDRVTLDSILNGSVYFTSMNDADDTRFALQDPDSPTMSLQNYYVVKDKDKNIQLTTYVMKRPLLLKHLVAHQILGIQTTSLNSLLQKMNDVNNALMRTAESFADTFNLPIQRHAVRLLLHHAQNGDFTILRHVMDELDEDKKAQPNPDAPMNSALVFRHTVSRIDDTTLKISLTDNAYATRNNDTVTQKNFDVAEGSPILIRIFPDGSLQYASATDDPDKRRWSQKPIGCVSSRIISLFRIVSDSDYFYHVHNRNEPMRQEVERILKDILSIQSLPDLLRYVRASSICSYSREELLLENSKVMMTPMLPQKNIPSIPMN